MPRGEDIQKAKMGKGAQRIRGQESNEEGPNHLKAATYTGPVSRSTAQYPTEGLADLIIVLPQ